MSDEATRERHTRHDGQFANHEVRIASLETASTKEITWRTGDETAHRGAESRLHRLEEDVVMRSEMKAIAAEVVTAYLKSFRGVLQTAAPYIVIAAGIIYALITGRAPPTVTP